MMQGLDLDLRRGRVPWATTPRSRRRACCHTRITRRAFANVKINGTVAGESGLNALVAQRFGVPVAVITGDQYVGGEAEPFCPGITAVQVKESISRYAAQHLHPERARELIREGVHTAPSNLDRVGIAEHQPAGPVSRSRSPVRTWPNSPPGSGE